MKKLLVILFIIAAGSGFGQIHYVVTKTTDHYPAQQGELRWAITEANNHPGYDYIDFNIPQTPPIGIQFLFFFPQTFFPSGSAFLLHITDPVMIDGDTQPGSASGNPKIEFKGFINMSGASALIAPSGSGTTIKNILFTSTANNYSILIDNSSNNRIENCVFHTYSDAGNYSGSTMAIIGNSKNNQIKGNYFGTDRSKTQFLPIRSAILISNPYQATINSPQNNVIGGPAATDVNYFYNSEFHMAVWVTDGCYGNNIRNNVFINNKKNISNQLFSASCGNICKSKPVITKAEITGSNITVEGTSGAGDFVEIYKTNTIGIDAEFVIGTDNADAAGNWTFTVPKGNLTVGHFVIGTATDANNNTSEFGGTAFPISNPCASCPSQSSFTYSPSPVFLNQAIAFTATNTCSGTITYSWDFGDPSSGANNTSTLQNPTHTFVSTGVHIVKLTTVLSGCTATKAIVVRVGEQIACENCIGSFAPEPGKYILSAWVKQENATPDTLFYHLPQIKIYFPTTPTNLGTSAYTCIASGTIIDGWQRIETEITIPAGSTYINLQLNSLAGNCFFDDIRILPKDGSMKSYVYDPVNLRLVAELDERNYATMYEYDEEGKLIRVKKETEKGIMTLKENKNSTKKQ